MKIIPTIEKLIEMHGKINRRLWVDGKKPTRLVSLKGRHVNAKPIFGPDFLIVYCEKGMRHISEKRPYHIFEAGWVTKKEVELVLGKDYPDRIYYHTRWSDYLEACDACNNGPVKANAYVFGTRWEGMIKESLVIPVQYYKISRRDHVQLGLNKKELKHLIEAIELERISDLQIKCEINSNF